MRKTLILLTTCAVLLTGCGGGGKGSEQPSSTATAKSTASAGATETTEATATESEGSANVKIKPEQIGQALIDGKYKEIYEQLSAEFQKQITREQLVEVIESVHEGVKAWNPNSQLVVNGNNQYTLVSQDGKIGVVYTMDEENRITGMRFIPLESFPESDNSLTKLAYGVPFTGEWYVFWGGRDVLSNYHYEFEMQRYAYDIIQVKEGSSYKGDASKNESYYAFGQPVLAPREGTIVRVVNDIKDNVPVGVMNEEAPAGNVVVIDHGNGEFSFLAHLQEGSAKVAVGDKVAKGDPVGLCGNSGNSSEPHLHYQVSDNADLFAGKSIRVQWEEGLDPRQGETIVH
ncbi:M23 family metallopeptidase [Cohnella herbarum]|uniref:M23 family metallopeptidase n=1 Tax=Cohnella herbarum TaxID=2728023 RepID=A0A7Z2ZPK1_9BACL|nr:M23 family metallopeptidase [Cohnella herbarum]QJD87259.1 M23 family metallopeptidase [Cohnella herbarum]